MKSIRIRKKEKKSLCEHVDEYIEPAFDPYGQIQSFKNTRTIFRQETIIDETERAREENKKNSIFHTIILILVESSIKPLTCLHHTHYWWWWSSSPNELNSAFIEILSGERAQRYSQMNFWDFFLLLFFVSLPPIKSQTRENV